MMAPKVDLWLHARGKTVGTAGDRKLSGSILLEYFVLFELLFDSVSISYSGYPFLLSFSVFFR